MKYLKLFDNHQDYTDFQPDMLTPNVSYCQLEDEVHFNEFKDTRLVAKFNVTSTSEPTFIADSLDPITNYFTAVEIDGVNMESMSNSYTFETTGEHIVKYTLADPTDVRDNAFYACTNITDAVVPDSVTRIGNSSFNGSGLESVILPKNLTSIIEGAFSNCHNLKRVIIPDSVTTLGNLAFSGCSSLEMVVIGNGVTELPTSLFSNCSSLVSVNIPNSVTRISSFVFNECNALSTITIGTGVTQIHTNAFTVGSNSNLASITSLSTTPASLTGTQDDQHLTSWAFESTNDCPIYVPSESLADYRKSVGAGGWCLTVNNEARFQAISV